jgi:hypothetical protein
MESGMLSRSLERTGVRKGIAVAWTLLIMVLCWMPTGGLEPRSGPRLINLPYLDKIVHFSLFFFFGFFWSRLVDPPRDWSRVVAAGLLLAVVTEWVQGWPIIARDPDLWDGVADVLGVSLAVAGVTMRRTRSSGRELTV